MNQPAKVVTFKNAFFVLSLLFFVTSLLVQIFITNKYAIKGMEMAKLDKQREELEKSISRLEIEKSQLSSLSALESRAKLLGFTGFVDTIYSIKPVTVASLPQYSN